MSKFDMIFAILEQPCDWTYSDTPQFQTEKVCSLSPAEE